MNCPDDPIGRTTLLTHSQKLPADFFSGTARFSQTNGYLKDAKQDSL